ncbi:peptide/nickel transport system substrate-binding protein [Modestobacter sp. DSM 44400]|uniref:ABC transporter substrate-binding protein n=1 Tax=Modestobacter sp. DSM 44400 TaxID=1550230 RepID=UPI00089475EA|nr:ABC transporter substrate-binding protein [Modestobacter sp. DSM 44400]SDY02347.1 peptide/nickel transport system substrate-binding protein [Modestobacter sp. DSM 44400]
MEHRATARRPYPSRVRPAAALLVLLALLTACGSGNSGAAGVPTQAGKPDAGVTGVRSPSTEPGGTLRLVSGPVDSLDPQRSYVSGMWNLMRLYTRTLVTYAAEPGHTDELVPDLATDLGTSPDGGRTWTFTLRDGVRFETGAPITSRDVKYGIERSFASDVIVGGPTYVVDLLDDPADQYAGPYQDETDGRLGLASVATPDDRTIVFTLTTATPDFPFVMALPSSSPVPSDADTGAGYGSDPVSSGPYAITSVDPEAGIVLDRNPQWDPATDDVRSALPDRVVLHPGLSGVARDQALLAGSADADLSGTGVQPATTSRMADTGIAGRIDDVTTGAVRLLALPTTVAPMDNVDCRAAVAAVVDRAAVQDVLGGAGSAVRSSQLWPRALTGAPQDPDVAPDLDAARAALTRCGKPDGFSTVLAVADAPSIVKVARSIADDLAQVGIQAEVRPLDPTTYYAADVGKPANVTGQGYGIVLATWTADFPTAASFLVPLVDGRSVRDVGNTNYARLADPAVDAAVDAARAAPDPPAASEAWRQVLTAVSATSAYVPLAENRVQLLAGQRLRNGVVMQPYGGYDVATAGVS